MSQAGSIALSFALASASAVLFNFCFPPYPYGKFLAWAALIPFFLGHSILPPVSRRWSLAFLYGFVFGFLYGLLVLSWTVRMFADWQGTFGAGAIATFLLCSAFALYLGAISLGCAAMDSFLGPPDARTKMMSRPWLLALLGPLMIAGLWVSVEYLMAQTVGDLTWTLAGYALWDSLATIQISSFTGIYGLSFLVVAMNAALAKACAILMRGLESASYRVRFAVLALVPATLLVVSSALYGRNVLATNPANENGKGERVSLAVIHSDVDMKKQFDPDFDDVSMDTYERILGTVRGNPSMIIWPETSLPDITDRTDPETLKRIRRIISRTNTYNLVGVLTGSDGRLYNSAVLFSPEGRIMEEYHKIKPLFFAETMPFFPTLNPADIVPGDSLTLFETADVPPLGVTLCWEPAFPGVYRDITRKGARLLANLSEGIWYYNNEKALSQHFVMNRFRAIENRRTIVVSGNRQYSGIVDPWGRFLKKVPSGSEAVFMAKVTPRYDLTFYTRFGDIFAWICLVLTALILPLAIKRNQPRG